VTRRWCKLLSEGALRRKPELVAEDGSSISPQCTLTAACRYTERTPIAHVREKVTTCSGQPLYSEFFELRPKSTLTPPPPPSSSSSAADSPLRHCHRLESSSSLPSPAAAAGGPVVRPGDTARLLHRTDCVYGHVVGGRVHGDDPGGRVMGGRVPDGQPGARVHAGHSDGHVVGGRRGFAATMAVATGRGRCRHHDPERPAASSSPRRAVSTDRLLAGKDLAAAAEVVSSRGQGGCGGGGGSGGAASPDILPGSDLEALVNSSTH